MLYVTTHTLCSVNVFYVSVSTSSFQRPGDDGMYGEYDVDHDDEEEEEAEGFSLRGLSGGRHTLEYNQSRVHRSTNKKRRELALVEVR